MKSYSADSLLDRWNTTLERIDDCARECGRSPEEVRLVAVSKTRLPEEVAELADEGQLLFGENKVQEALAKIPLCPGKIEWHFLGHLQKNKIRKALPAFSLFHGVDSLELARQIERIAGEDGQRPKILLEVNTSGESSKFGFPPDVLEAQFEEILALSRLEVLGLMTMAPLVPKPELARPFFARLREFRDRLQDRFAAGLPELSMGMTGDFEPAIQEGATLVRIGTAIFGERKRR